MGYWRTLGRDYLESKGVTNVSDEVLEFIKPMTVTQSAEYFIAEFGLSGSPEIVAAAMNSIMENHYRFDIPLKQGVKDYLRSLSERNVKMCVASATAEHLMEACLLRNGVHSYFDFVLSCESVGVGKDNPDVYFEAAKRLGAAPSEIAVYEDVEYAATTARNAGFYVVGVYDEASKNSWERLKNIAHETVTNFK